MPHTAKRKNKFDGEFQGKSGHAMYPVTSHSPLSCDVTDDLSKPMCCLDLFVFVFGFAFNYSLSLCSFALEITIYWFVNVAGVFL